MKGIYCIYAHDKLAEGGISPKAHYIGTVFSTSAGAALKQAKGKRDWQAVYKGFRLERPADLRRNPALRAQVRRLPSGEVQLKIPLTRNPASLKSAMKYVRKLGRRVKSVVVTGMKTKRR